MKKTALLFTFVIFTTFIKAACIADTNFVETKITLKTKTGDIFGTLTTPKKFKKIPVALIIAGSGPTDRNGNNPYSPNDGLRKLAYGLVEGNVASLRFDKRGIGESQGAAKSESDLRFEDYINDAKEWITLLKKDSRFSKVIVVGHSEGSLIGMIAGKEADKYVSIAGAGFSADVVLKEQLGAQSKEIQDMTFPLIDSLKSGKTLVNVDPRFNSLFRASVQPYLISWFKYDPKVEIQKLSIPAMIIQGTNDIQVSVENAKALSASNPKAEFILINNMNHIFRIVEGDKTENVKTYSDPSLPISSELIKKINDFILKN